MNGIIIVMGILLISMMIHLLLRRNWLGLLVFFFVLFLIFGTGHRTWYQKWDFVYMASTHFRNLFRKSTFRRLFPVSTGGGGWWRQVLRHSVWFFLEAFLWNRTIFSMFCFCSHTPIKTESFYNQIMQKSKNEQCPSWKPGEALFLKEKCDYFNQT